MQSYLDSTHKANSRSGLLKKMKFDPSLLADFRDPEAVSKWENDSAGARAGECKEKKVMTN